MRRDGVNRPVRAQAAGFLDIDFEAIGRRPFARNDRFDAKVLVRQHLQIVNRTRHDRCNDNLIDCLSRMAFDLEQLHQPYRIFITGAARISRDPPARLDRPRLTRCGSGFEQGKNHICVAGIDNEQHQLFLQSSTSAA